mmetsp:Transcript_105324/g.324868  ORF Transcript_105324/g.324868 Transcript_105324/m.324868 type:complete len:218 (-) Transcript_105324:1118-1771(-)
MASRHNGAPSNWPICSCHHGPLLAGRGCVAAEPREGSGGPPPAACGCVIRSRQEGPSADFFELKNRGGPPCEVPERAEEASSARPPDALRPPRPPLPSCRCAEVGDTAEGAAGAAAAPWRPRPSAAQGSSFGEGAGAASRRRPSAAHPASCLSVGLAPTDSSCGFPLSQGGVAALSFRLTTVPASASSLARCSCSCALSRRKPLCWRKRCSRDWSSV